MRFIIGTLSLLWALSGSAANSALPDYAITQPASERMAWEDLPNRELSLGSAQSLPGIGEEESFLLGSRAPSTNRRTHSNFTPVCGTCATACGHCATQRRNGVTSTAGLQGFVSDEDYLYAIRRLRI